MKLASALITLALAGVAIYPEGRARAHRGSSDHPAHAPSQGEPDSHPHPADLDFRHGTPAARAAASPTRPAKTYVCPPCGCESDGKTFERPGACPSCEMELVEKSEDSPSSAAPEALKVVVKSAQAVEPPPSHNVTAAYMVIENLDASEVALTSAASDSASAVELHAMEIAEGGMMRMRKVERIAVPAGGSVELKPGGLHLMFIGLKREIRDGEELTVTLLFSNSTKKTVTMPVRKRPAE